MQDRIHRRPLLQLGRHLRRLLLPRIPFAEVHLPLKENGLRQCLRFRTKVREITGQLLPRSSDDLLKKQGLQQREFGPLKTPNDLFNLFSAAFQTATAVCQQVLAEAEPERRAPAPALRSLACRSLPIFLRFSSSPTIVVCLKRKRF